jgi:hypothetical protein
MKNSEKVANAFQHALGECPEKSDSAAMQLEIEATAEVLAVCIRRAANEEMHTSKRLTAALQALYASAIDAKHYCESMLANSNAPKASGGVPECTCNTCSPKAAE